MHRLAAKVVRQALSGGAMLDPLNDFDALAELDAVARESDLMPQWREVEVLETPVVVGDPDARGRCAVLYPPSYAALIWIEDYVEAFFGNATLKGNLACAWALAHAHNPDAFAAASTPRMADRAVKHWAAHLNCGIEALMAVTKRLLGADEDNAVSPNPEAAIKKTENSRKKKMNMRLILARLTYEFGQEEDYFLFGPRDRMNAALELLQQKDKEERKAIAKAEGKTVVQDPDSPEVQAFVRWRDASDAFLERYKP